MIDLVASMGGNGCVINHIPYLYLPPYRRDDSPIILASESRLAVTIKELMDQTVQRTKDAARSCTAQEVPRSATLKKRNPLLWTYRTRCGESSSDPQGHVQHFKVLLEFDSRGKKGKHKLEEMIGEPVTDFHVGVRCSCPAFVYWVSEYISWQDGYKGAETPRGKIVPPQINLRFKNGESTSRSFICKHLMAAGKLWSRKKIEV